MSDDERTYVPHQHQSKPLGCAHETIFASVELWVDDPPDVMTFGGFRYVRDGGDGDAAGGDDDDGGHGPDELGGDSVLRQDDGRNRVDRGEVEGAGAGPGRQVMP